MATPDPLTYVDTSADIVNQLIKYIRHKYTIIKTNNLSDKHIFAIVFYTHSSQRQFEDKSDFCLSTQDMNFI